MKHRIVVALFISALLCANLPASEELSVLVESALERAGGNAVQLRKALDEVPDAQTEGMQFLIAYMPDRDLQSLSADFLLNNVNVAYQALNEAPWKDQIPKAIFLNDVLPYASINEHRDNWRQDFYQRFKPLVEKAKTPAEAAMTLNQEIFKVLNVSFSRKRPKADQSPYETIKAGMASCSGLSILLIDACRAVGVPARFAGTPLWTDNSGNHSWVEIWDNSWHYTGGGEPAGDKLDSAWFTGKARTAQRDQRLNAIYATSFKHTDQTFPLVWNRKIDYIYAVNVTDRYTAPQENAKELLSEQQNESDFDVEASLHAVNQLKNYLKTPRADRPPLADALFADVPLTQKDAEQARQLLWADYARHIKETCAEEMQARQLTAGDLIMPFYYSVTGDKPENGRSLFISMHGGGGAPKKVNDRQWKNQKKLYRIPEGVYVAPRAPNDAWNMWHQKHMDGLFDRLITDMIVFEDVNPNRVYLLGYSAGGDGVYQLAPRMADRFAAASMMAGHPNDASPLGLRNLPFTIHVGEKDAPYDRNTVAAQWAQKLDDLQKKDPNGYVHWTKIHKGKGHWMDREDAEAIPWMAQYTRNPFPKKVVWKQDDVTHTRFYWLAVKPEDCRRGVEVQAVLKGQQFDVQTDDIGHLIIRVNDKMLDLDKEIIVKSGDKELFKGRVNRSIETLEQTLAERGDPSSVFSGEIVVTLREGS